jgi:nitrate reductase NapAB chaperone NapD
MWKKQWDKLKTALGTPDEYVEEEQVEEMPVTEVEVEEVQYCSDPVIEIKPEDINPIMENMESMKNLKGIIGEMILRHRAELDKAIEINSNLNTQFNKQIAGLRTIYNVEPTVDYTLNFPSEVGGSGTFTRQSDED